MDTRQLKTLLSIHSQGTFARAADEVGLTPSAVSHQIHALEQELNVVIFDRASRPPKFTSQGMQVLDMAKDILQREDDAKAVLRGSQIAGTLLLGSVRSSALNLLPRALLRMRDEYPQLKINLRVSLSAPMITDVASGRLDAAMVAEHIGFPHALRWSPFLKEPLWLITPSGTASRDPIHLLNTQPYVRFHSPVPLANLIDTELSRLGVVTQDIAHIDTIGSIVTCVRQGLGISVVPHVALQEPGNMEIEKIPFGAPQVTRQIGLVDRVNSPRRELTRALHGVLVDLCGPYGVRTEEE